MRIFCVAMTVVMAVFGLGAAWAVDGDLPGRTELKRADLDGVGRICFDLFGQQLGDALNGGIGVGEALAGGGDLADRGEYLAQHDVERG